MTKRAYLEDIRRILASYDDTEYDGHLEFLDKEIAALDKRNLKAKERRAKQTPKAHDAITEEIKSVLVSNGVPMTIPEIGIAADCTNAQAIYRLNALTKEGFATKHVAKVEGRKITLYAVSSCPIE